ncbi:hypothetical protein EDB89DRAFT_2018514 [Lactarius sanguifluus]|nr:hypothetical protein EDB89DRAFT_2018514 [Lactarius sanguifluus]
MLYPHAFFFLSVVLADIARRMICWSLKREIIGVFGRRAQRKKVVWSMMRARAQKKRCAETERMIILGSVQKGTDVWCR